MCGLTSRKWTILEADARFNYIVHITFVYQTTVVAGFVFCVLWLGFRLKDENEDQGLYFKLEGCMRSQQ